MSMYQESMSPALEMLYSNVKDNIVYSAKQNVPLPKTDEDGKVKSHLLVMMTPTQEATFEELKSDYLMWWRNGYKFYTSDTVFKGKIGRKRIFINNTALTRKKFSTLQLNHPLRYMSVKQRDTMLKKEPNLILDLGEWNSLYFQYSFKVAIPVIVKKFISFFTERLSDPQFNAYDTKLVYFPLNRWFAQNHSIDFRRDGLTNPVTILLFAAYRYPEMLDTLPRGIRFIFGDSINDQFIMYPIEFFTKKNFPKIRMRMQSLKIIRWNTDSEKALDTQFSTEEEDENSDLNNTEFGPTYADPRKVVKEPENLSNEEVAKYNLKMKNRARLINEAKRKLLVEDESPQEVPFMVSDAPKADPNDPFARLNKGSSKVIPVATNQEDVGANPFSKALVGSSPLTKTKVPSKPVAIKKNSGDTEIIGQTVQTTVSAQDDITTDPLVYEDEELVNQTTEDDDIVPIIIDEEGTLDDQVEEAVDGVIKEMQENDPDVLLNADGNLDANTVNYAVQAQLKRSFVPNRTEEQKERVKLLSSEQSKIVKKPTTAQRVKSNIIKETDLSKAVNTANPALQTAKFSNFDKCYNEQKLQGDIDNAVAALSRASSPIFVVSKTEEDTSDGLNLKKTITYNMKDMYGGTHTIKVDIPVILDNNYLYINGSKIILGHQMMMMPIIKANPTDVQVISWYSKMTVRRMGVNDARTNSVKGFLIKNSDIFEVVPGNAMNRNIAMKYDSTLDIDMYARSIVGFTINGDNFILDRDQLLKTLAKVAPNVTIRNDENSFAVGYSRKKKEVIYVTPEHTLTDLIMERLTDSDRSKISKGTKESSRKVLRSTVKVRDRFIPLVTLLFFYEGFTEVMKKAEINYKVIEKTDSIIMDFDKHVYGTTELADCYIIWERTPIWNTMLMNGLVGIDLTVFTKEEMDSQETWANILSGYYGNRAASLDLLQFYDFMIDPVTEEILEDHDLPTDLVSLLLLANKMLADNSFTPSNNAKSFRIRSNEIIAQMVYKEVTQAYKKFRATEYKAAAGGRRKPDRVSIKQGNPIKKLITDSSLTNEASDLNPILTMEKNRAVTPKGPSGINKDRAMTLAKRTYDPSMMGIIGITSSPDGKIGISRQLVMEPNITSVRGYVKVAESDEEIDAMKNINMLTPAELLSPPGVLHDDGPRTAMSYKQSQYMIPTEGSCPVFFGNKVESAIPYHLDREFTIVAKDDGKVIEIQDGVIIIQYKDGSYDSIDTNPKMKKNSSGFYVEMKLVSRLQKVGDKFKKNEVIANNPRAFTKNNDDLSAAMNIGVPTKVAILPSYDIYEDSAPISAQMSKKFATHMAMHTGVGIPMNSYVEKCVSIGDIVEVGDPLIVYDPAHEDETTNAFLNQIRDKLDESLNDIIDLAAMPQVRAEYAGRISSIEAYTSVPVEELSPTLRDLFLRLTEHTTKVNKLLTKYQNPNDFNYYKCGQLIKGAREVVSPNYANRVKGYTIGDDGKGVVLIFYIDFEDIAKIGDKGSAYTALKFTTSHVTQEGLEAYSEYRPEEEISTIIAPGSVLARKVPSIWETMATNKCLIEMTRHALDIFFKDTDGDPAK